ncbi:MAG: hypothetical protein FJZ15_04115 [Candidatus Omnitrophica bacterium]|nr:hypothetical protein [Candidatus Omnitrophota bacterium]
MNSTGFSTTGSGVFSSTTSSCAIGSEIMGTSSGGLITGSAIVTSSGTIGCKIIGSSLGGSGIGSILGGTGTDSGGVRICSFRGGRRGFFALLPIGILNPASLKILFMLDFETVVLKLSWISSERDLQLMAG